MIVNQQNFSNFAGNLVRWGTKSGQNQGSASRKNRFIYKKCTQS